MSDVPWLTLLIAMPIVGAIVVAYLPRAAAGSRR